MQWGQSLAAMARGEGSLASVWSSEDKDQPPIPSLLPKMICNLNDLKKQGNKRENLTLTEYLLQETAFRIKGKRSFLKLETLYLFTFSFLNKIVA